MPELSSGLPADAMKAIAKHGAIALQPYGAEQRHLSLRVLTSRDEALWLKINVTDDLASVGREALVLSRLTSVPSVPRYLDSGSDGSWLLMTSVEGVQLAELTRAAKGQALPAVASWLDVFRAGATPLPDLGVSDRDLCGRSCDLASVLEPALAWSAQAGVPLKRDLLLSAIHDGSPAFGPVHGSFDAHNIIVGHGGTAGAVDFEAARPGLTSYDTAALLASLSDSDPILALEWWKLTVARAHPSEAAFVLGHLLVRTWHRHCAGALRRGAVESLASFWVTAVGHFTPRT